MLATEILEKILVVSTRTPGHGEETLLSSDWTLIGSELSSSSFHSSVRAEQSFAIRYLNVVIKPFCGNLDICLSYYANAYFRSQNSVRVLRSRTATESERCFSGSRFSVALLHNLADFATEIHFDHEKPKHTNAPIVCCAVKFYIVTFVPVGSTKFHYISTQSCRVKVTRYAAI